MRKITQIIKEASEFEDMEDTLLLIYDLLGKPRISTFSVGESPAYVLKWTLDFSINEYQGSDVIDKVGKLFESIKEIRSSQRRIFRYRVEFKLAGVFLFIRLTPTSKSSSENYHFIKGQDWREIKLSYGEIARFFRDNGFSIKNIDIEDNELDETSSVIIVTNADTSTVRRFADMFNQEFDSRKDIVRNIQANVYGGNSVSIFPEEEKTYVVIDQDI